MHDTATGHEEGVGTLELSDGRQLDDVTYHVQTTGRQVEITVRHDDHSALAQFWRDQHAATLVLQNGDRLEFARGAHESGVLYGRPSGPRLVASSEV